MIKNRVIPIALFTYARPDHLAQVLEGLRKNNVPLIYAFSDGPKDITKIEKVNKVRELLREINWADKIIVEHDLNLGIGTSLRVGITDVLSKHEKVIVIEDDIVLRPGAYNYTCQALNYYENHDKVMTISMWSYPTLVPKGSNSGFFSERFVCWGWGTYQKYWHYYDKDPENLFFEAIQKRKDLLMWGKDLKVQALNAKKYNVWYVGYALSHFIHDKYSYLPSESLIVNIGRDGQASHTISGLSDDYGLINKPVYLPDKWPDVILHCRTNDRFRYYFDFENKNILRRLLIKISKAYAKIVHKISDK